MPDFGTDMGNVGVNVMAKGAEKFIDTLMALVGKGFDLWKERTNPEWKIRKSELKLQKDKMRGVRLAKQIDGMAGFINYKVLERAGVPLTATKIHCSEEQLKDLSSACARSGIIITALEDVRSRELGGPKDYVVSVRQKDLERFADLADALNDAKRIAYLEEEKQAVLALGDAMTEEDRLYVAALDEEILHIRDGRRLELNIEQAQGAIEAVAQGYTAKGISLSEALDRWTGGEIDRDTTAYVVDATDPDKYIVATARPAEFEGEPYIKTTYEVYNSSKLVLTADDGRFEGRTANYWPATKREIQNAGGLGDTVIKFYSLAEMERYRQAFKAQQRAEIDTLRIGEADRDYDKIRTALEQKVRECGYEHDEYGTWRDENGEPLEVREGTSLTEQAAAAEAIICLRQIALYNEMETVEGELSIARAETLTYSKGTAEHAKAVARSKSLEGKYEELTKRETGFAEEREKVNFVQAHEECQQMKEPQELVPEKGSFRIRNSGKDIDSAIIAAKTADAEKNAGETVKAITKGIGRDRD